MLRFFLAILTFFGAMFLAATFLKTSPAGTVALGAVGFIIALSTSGK